MCAARRLGEKTMKLAVRRYELRRFFSCTSKKSAQLPRISVAVSDGVADEFEKEDFLAKKHPGILFRGKTSLPYEFMDAAEIILNKNLVADLKKPAADLRKYIISRNLPVEDDEYKEICQNVEEKVRAEDHLLEPFLCEEELKSLEHKRFNRTKKLVKQQIYHWEPINYTGNVVYEYLMVRSAPEYGALYKIFSEIAKRNPDFRPESLLDFGSGLGTVCWAANAFWNESLNEHLCVDTSRDMSDLAELILRGGNHNAVMKFRNIFFRQFLPSSPTRQYDLVTCAYSLMELSSAKERINILNTLWRKCSKYLVIVEYGADPGFRLINEARDFILGLDREQRGKIKCHVFSPCPHDTFCPKFAHTPSPCKFEVVYRPLLPFGKEMVRRECYTYVVIERGRRKKEEAWPRLVEAPLLRPRHVVCRMCMPDGKIRESCITKSKCSKNLYKSARKSRWGDFLPIKEILNSSTEMERSDDDERQTIVDDENGKS